jgi:hypothetical protein
MKEQRTATYKVVGLREGEGNTVVVTTDLATSDFLLSPGRPVGFSSAIPFEFKCLRHVTPQFGSEILVTVSYSRGES